MRAGLFTNNKQLLRWLINILLSGQFSDDTHVPALEYIPLGQKQPSTHSWIQDGGLSLFSQVNGQFEPQVVCTLPLVHTIKTEYNNGVDSKYGELKQTWRICTL